MSPSLQDLEIMPGKMAVQAEVRFSGENRSNQLGINYGTVTNIFHGFQSPIIEKVEPCSTVPSAAEKGFTGRADILEQIEGRLSPSLGHCRVALVGLGGVGKSQIAIQSAVRYRKNFPDTWVFWVTATDTGTFTKSYHDIANAANLIQRKEESVLDLVSRWLNDEKNGRWLMIVDGADDPEQFFGKKTTAGRALANYIPSSSNGAVIITTRDKIIGLNFWVYNQPINVEPLSEADAKDLFSKNYRPHVDEDVTEESVTSLLSRLEYLPLAIMHALSFMLQCEFTVEDYLGLLVRNEVEVLSRNLHGSTAGPDSKIPLSVVSTFTISFELISKTEPVAGELFSLMCFFNRQGISEKLLADTNLFPEVDLKVALGLLKSYRFVKPDISGKSFELHRLVQLSMKAWLDKKKDNEEDTSEYGEYVSLALQAISNEFGVEEDAQAWPQLLLHAEAVLESQPKELNPLDLVFKTSLLHHAARRASDQGDFKKGERWLQELVEIEKKNKGQKHDDTLEAQQSLAQLYGQSGEWNKAVALQELVVEERKLSNGEKNPESLTSMECLANMYMGQGVWSKAENLSERVVKLSKEMKSSMPDHFQRMIDLANIYLNMGKQRLAQDLAHEVNKGLDNLETDDPELQDLRFQTMRTLAWTYRDQGKLDDAMDWGKRLVDMKVKSYGKRHRSTLDSMSDLALIYQAKGMFSEAETIGIEIVRTLGDTIGKTHPNTLASLSNLGLVYEKLGKLEEAEECISFVVEQSKIVLGEEHRDTLLSMGILASIYRDLGRLEQAASLGKTVLDVRQRVLPKYHQDVLFGVISLAMTYHKQGRFVDARHLMLQLQDKPSFAWNTSAGLGIIAVLIALLLNLLIARKLF